MSSFAKTMDYHGYTNIGNGYFVKLDKEFPFHFHLAWEDNLSGEWDEVELAVENTKALIDAISRSIG